jgi:hypothetical protein
MSQGIFNIIYQIKSHFSNFRFQLTIQGDDFRDKGIFFMIKNRQKLTKFRTLKFNVPCVCATNFLFKTIDP